MIFPEGDFLEVLRKLSLAAAVCRKVCAGLRLLMNFERGKTEAMAQSGASKSDEDGVPLLPIDDGGRLRLVKSCTHLGSKVIPRGTCHEERAARRQAATEAAGALRKNVRPRRSERWWQMQFVGGRLFFAAG